MKQRVLRLVGGSLVALALSVGGTVPRPGSTQWSAICATLEPGSVEWYWFLCFIDPPEKDPRT